MTAGQLGQWLAVLDAYGVQFLVVDKQRDRALLELARSHPNWSIDVEDEASVLFTRVQKPAPAGRPGPGSQPGDSRWAKPSWS